MITENEPKVEKFEEIEATGENDDVELEDYPLDSFLIRTESRTVFGILRRMKDGYYILDPDFQREFIWDETKQSRLIESALINAHTTPRILFGRTFRWENCGCGWLTTINDFFSLS